MSVGTRNAPEISVIVPARDSAATIGRTLGALARQEVDRPFEVIVALDGRSADTVAAIERSALRPKVVPSPANGPGGPGAARNRGVEAARGRVLAFTDADCVPTPNWLLEGSRALEQADLVQGAVLPDPGTPVGPFDRTVTVVSEVGLYETANIFVRRDLFERLGGFEDWMPESETDTRPPMGEDVWFGWRARRSGARTVFCLGALVHHAVFRGGVPEYIAEYARLRYFPPMARRIPELRRRFFYRRYFLTRRSAAFDAAAAGAALGRLAGSPWPLVVAIPYAAILVRESQRYGGRSAIKRAAATLAADAVGLVALAHGSVKARTLVL